MSHLKTLQDKSECPLNLKRKKATSCSNTSSSLTMVTEHLKARLMMMMYRLKMLLKMVNKETKTPNKTVAHNQMRKLSHLMQALLAILSYPKQTENISTIWSIN